MRKDEKQMAEKKDWNSLETKFHAPPLHNFTYCEENKQRFKELQRIKNVQKTLAKKKNNHAEKPKPTKIKFKNIKQSTKLPPTISL